MSVRILTGDCREMLRSLDPDSVDCVVTSPPYWGLRDYGVDGQLGMERTLGEHVETMTEVFREVRRVLKPTGTLWLNYGDSYATSVNGRSAADTKATGNDDRTFRDKPFSTVGPVYDPNHRPAGTNRSRGLNSGSKQVGNESVPLGRIVAGGYLKPKDICGIPWRVAFALQEDGWWLRQDIIWSKPNPMPESVTDRCTKAHEYLFLLAKSERYYFDQDAISEALADSSVERLSQPNLENQYGSDRVPGKTNGPMKAVARSAHMAGTSRNDGNRWRTADGGVAPRGSRNKRSVWEVATAPFSEAHFATFPPALIEPCILAGCPKGGTVLDPFFGAGATGLVADRLGRNCIGIELNPAYVEIAQRRIKGDCPMFAELT